MQVIFYFYGLFCFFDAVEMRALRSSLRSLKKNISKVITLLTLINIFLCKKNNVIKENK